MKSVRKIAEEIVAREGGYVNDPDDPGGATNFGVTIHTMRRLGLDLDKSGDVDVKDVKLLSKEKAVDIFVDHYFKRPKISALPEVLQPSVFDMYVNAGANAVKILQRLMGEMGYDITVDGQIGPQTVRIVHEAERRAPKFIADAYGIARRNYYYALADKRPASRKYARRRDGGKGGWIRRAEEFLSEKYRLTTQQHQQRISRWA